jgi:apolipoprotein N-acyltransferase
MRSPFFFSSKVLLAFASGICMGLGTAPTSAWFLAWVAIAPLWAILADTKERNLALVYSLAWGIGYHGLALSWITGIHPMTWLGVPWLASLGIAVFCLVFITLWGAAIVTLWGWGMWLTRLTPFWLQILIATALWCSLEALWSQGALFWSSISYTQSPNNLFILHLGQISGPSTITAAILLVNGCLAKAWLNRKQTHQFLSLGCILLIFFHLIGWGLYRIPLPESPDTALKVGIIQGNIPNEIKLSPPGWQKAIEGYTTGYQALADLGAQGVLTPEGALPFSWEQVKNTSFYTAIREKKVVAWLGAFADRGGNSYSNALLTISGTGEILSEYYKVKLVPLGEYIPFKEILGGLINRLSPLQAEQIPGSENQVFDTPFGRAIAAICYESAFSQIFRHQAANGGGFILSASNDAHYSPTMPAQHHALDIMRAIETQRWALRAVNTGYSGVIDPHGHTVWRSELKAYQTHLATIFRLQTQTLYVRWGDWLTPLLLAVAILAWLRYRYCPKTPRKLQA